MAAVETKGKYGKYIQNIITLGDFLVLNVAFLLTWLILGRFTALSMREVVLIINMANVPVAVIFGGKLNWRTLQMQYVVRYALLSVITNALCLILLLYWINSFTLTWRFFATFYPTLAVLLALWWISVRKIMKIFRRRGRNTSNVIIIGTGSTAQTLHQEIMADEGYGYRFLGYFSNDPEPGVDRSLVRGDLAAVAEFIANNHVDEVFYTLSGENVTVLRQVIEATENSVARFYYVPQINRYASRSFTLSSVGSVPVLSLMNQPLESLMNRTIKRTFDILFSSAFLIVSPIIFIPVAIAIKLSSPGPVFFKQKRTGYKGRDFECWKFRTMRVNANADSQQATRDDPRKTKVGDFLRKSSIDELPQFINVFLGSMSVVGPRPHMLKHTQEYSRMVDKYMVRHYIKPGITGWAQVCGLRGQTDELWKMEKRVEHDVWYIQNWTFLLDLRIIVRTITNAIHGEKNAF